MDVKILSLCIGREHLRWEHFLLSAKRNVYICVITGIFLGGYSSRQSWKKKAHIYAFGRQHVFGTLYTEMFYQKP